MRKIRQRTIFIVFGLLILGIFSLSALEICLRISINPAVSPNSIYTHPLRRYALKPLFKGKTYSIEFKTNSLGLRDYERPILDDAYKIAIFGDSITFGIGVSTEKTFAKFLENKLNSEHRNKPPIQVFNLGVPSYNTVQEYRYMTQSYSTFKPDMIILEFSAGNDALTLADIGSGVNKHRILRGIKDVLRNLYAYDFMATKLYRFIYNRKLLRYRDPYQGRFAVDNLCYQESYAGWIEAQKAFLDIKHFCARNNIILIFAIFANNIKVSPIFEEDLMYLIIEKVKTALQDIGAKHVLIIDDAFREYAGKERLLWATPVDSHLSELAHELVAEQILKYIDKHNLLVKKQQYN